MKKLILSFVLLTGLQAQAKALDCVNVYFDRSTDPTYWMGKTYTTLLQNLLGHFPEYQQIISPIELYQQGEIDKCAATIYIGSYFNNPIPTAFLDDYASTKKNVAWIGYKSGSLARALKKPWGTAIPT